MKNGKSITSVISNLHNRMSLTLKMVCIAVIVGVVMWVAFDLIQTNKLENIFQARLDKRLEKQALADRLHFDRYVKAHLHSTKLFISQRGFSDYIDSRKWSEDGGIEVKIYRRSPRWFPKSSVLRTFIQPRLALLLDARGRVREIYKGLHDEQIPEFLLEPTPQLLIKSRGQNFMRNFEGIPYLMASEYYKDESGKVKAMLMLASPIDDIFLANAIGSVAPGHAVGLLTGGESVRILTSSNLADIPPGTPLEELEKHYLVTGKEFFDYGASEQAIKFVSFNSLDEVRSLIQSITASERQLRIIGFPVLVGSFALLMFWVTRRIQLLTYRISDFARRTLGMHSKDLREGDQLYRLEKRFQHLTEEVLEARDLLRKEGEEKLLWEKKNIEMKLKEKELVLLQSVTQAVGVGVIRKTAGGLTAVNRQMEEFADLCGGLSGFDIVNVDDTDYALTDKHGNNMIFNIRSPEIFTEEKILLVRDVTKFKEQTEALEHMAMHDSLSGLPNRALLRDRLQQAIFVGQREDKPLALLMMDLDRFKEINDTLGHHVGDLVLREVAERLPVVLRKSDTFARLGGDEFAVVLPATDKEHATEAANKLLKALEKPFVIDGHNLFVGASMGMVFFPEHGDDASTLLQRADVAMYVAKNAQTGFSIYNPDHDQNSLQNLVLMGALRIAIERDGLSLCYQPKVDYKTDRVNGLEALVRWNHPQHGFIAPDEFIPIAEYTGLIKPLTMWVLDTALRQYVEWRHEGIDMEICMSVNLSVRNLQDAGFPKEVAYLLKAWCIKPEYLEFEITESAVMSDPDHAMQVLTQLDNIGVRLSIDDFGTGYSSLSYLKKLPVDEIKIDKSFVMNMSNDESDAMIVRSTIDLAHNLGLSVIAEGVDSRKVFERLKKLGCDRAQGYYICHPVTADEIVKWSGASEWPIAKDEKKFQSG